MNTSTTKDPGLAAGVCRKNNAFGHFMAHREILLLKARRALLLACLARADGTGTADDIRAGVPLPPGVNPVCFGAAPGLLAEAGILRCIGFAVSRRPEAHARPVRLWHLVDPAAAVTWLRSHPDPDAPAPRTQTLLFDARRG
jgi:hypothetical protein